MSRASLPVVAELAARGVTVNAIAARLGIDPSMAEAMVDELSRLGIVEVASKGVPRAPCTSCTPSPICAACPVASLSGPAAQVR